MWEEPEVVALKDCRYDVALVVDNVEPTGEVGRFEFPPMRVGEVVLNGAIDLEVRAFDWLTRPGYPGAASSPMINPRSIGRPFAHGNEHFTIACQLPVKRA